MTQPRYGARRIVRMYADINRLRRAIRAQGTPEIQSAWDRVEPHIDFAYQRALDPQPKDNPDE